MEHISERSRTVDCLDNLLEGGHPRSNQSTRERMPTGKRLVAAARNIPGNHTTAFTTVLLHSLHGTTQVLLNASGSVGGSWAVGRCLTLELSIA